MTRCISLPLVAVLILGGLLSQAVLKTHAQNPASTATPPATPAETQAAATSSATSTNTISIPGPLRSFLRMSAISQKVSPNEIAPLMARNIFLLGYEGPQNQARETEFLVLLNRYVQQARELVNLAGPTGIIHVSNCEDAKPLLQILGYRERPDCGQKSTFVETVDPQRAFLTIDSGFPLPDLERVLQEGKPFAYSVPTSRVPVIFTEADWVATSRRNKPGENKDLIDTLLHDPVLARLYWGMGRVDRDTQDSLRQNPGLKKLYPLAAVLDFYGSHIQIRSGRVVVPGGPSAEEGWKDLVGVSPDNPGEFVFRLLSKDSGWLAAYFDSLSRTSQVQQAKFTESKRLRRDYEALRGKENTADAARGVFRSDPRLLLLLTRMQWDPNSQPHVPGNIDAWRRILAQKSDSPVVREWGRRSRHWETPEQMLEGMFALSRVQSESGPLQAYLLMCDLDSQRPPDRKLSADTVLLIASKFSEFSDQYLLFAEFPELDDASIAAFANTAASLDGIHNQALRGNSMGTFQATVSIWQILARQGEIRREDLNASFQKILKPWGKINSPVQMFDAGRASLKEIALAATDKPQLSQDQIIELLAGPMQVGAEAQRMHQLVANRMRAVLEAQRLISLDTIVNLGDGLHEVSYVKAQQATLLPLAQELREFEMPQPIFKNSERDQWAAGIYNNHHTEAQMKADLTKVVKAPNSPEQLAEARGHLSSLLRDTLVGLNYAYYEPPGAQILHNNPLFVRSHDFSGDTVTGVEKQAWQAPQLFGAGSPAGGGARLVGSLADLPYVLADAEQDFIAPENVQALILAPGRARTSRRARWSRAGGASVRTNYTQSPCINAREKNSSWSRKMTPTRVQPCSRFFLIAWRRNASILLRRPCATNTPSSSAPSSCQPTLSISPPNTVTVSPTQKFPSAQTIPSSTVSPSLIPTTPASTISRAISAYLIPRSSKLTDARYSTSSPSPRSWVIRAVSWPSRGTPTISTGHVSPTRKVSRLSLSTRSCPNSRTAWSKKYSLQTSKIGRHCCARLTRPAKNSASAR